MTLPNKFTFNHTTYPDDVRTVELVDGAYKEQPTSPDGMCSLWPIKEVQRFFDPQVNLWENLKAVAEPVSSLVEQLVSVAAAHCYCFSVFPDGAVTLQDLSEDDPRVIDLKDVGTALKWFDLKVQLDALETDGN